MDDAIIKMYIDEVFQVYDFDRNGTLDLREVHNFFNELYASLNESRRFSEQDMRMLFSTIDIQQDGKITKPELFILFKRIWENPGLTPFQIAALHNTGQQLMNPGGMPPYMGQQQPQQQPQQQYGQQFGQYGQQPHGQQQQYNQQYEQPQNGQYGQQYQQNHNGQYGQQNWGKK